MICMFYVTVVCLFSLAAVNSSDGVHQRLYSQLVVTVSGIVTETQALSAMDEKWILSWLYTAGHEKEENCHTWKDWVMLRFFFSHTARQRKPCSWSLVNTHSKAHICAAILKVQRNGEQSCSEVAGGCLDSWLACVFWEEWLTCHIS